MTISKAADRSSNISNEDLEAALASLRASTTESKAMSTSEARLIEYVQLSTSREYFFVKKIMLQYSINLCILVSVI